MKVTFVAMPLTARSGVYRSGRELVAAGRAQGHKWNLLLGVSKSAKGKRPEGDPAWIDEIVAEPHGPGGVLALKRTLLAHPAVNSADIIVSLIPQTDMALALTGKRWVAFVRGLPWPAAGEAPRSKQLIWMALERAALHRAEEVWATTSMLRDDMRLNVSTSLVPAGIAEVPRRWNGVGARASAVWAARFDHDKNPGLFFEALREQAFTGKMFGGGALESELRNDAPSNVEIVGWAGPEKLWDDAFAYVGTSTREAFGRSALEAAMSGIPIVVSDAFGVAEALVTDDDLLDKFVLPVSRPKSWAMALRELHVDEDLRRSFSDHLVQNAAKLTIDASAQAVAQELTALLQR